MAIADWRAIVISRVKDNAKKLSSTDIDSAITEAVKRYSQQHPLEKVQTITGTGSAFLFALASDFEDGFSGIASIEYPTGQQEPLFLEESRYAVRRQTDNSLKLQFKDLTLANAATAYATYTIRHSVTESPAADTVPVADREAVCKLAAAICFRELAALYAQSADANLGAIALDYQTKTSTYIKLAEELEAKYMLEVGEQDGIVAANMNTDIDVALQNGAGDRFWHPRAFR